MKTIIVGIGNPILGDDGIGIHVLHQVQKKIGNLNDVFFEEAMTGGMNLLDLMTGFEKAILIDAVRLSNEPVGSVKRIDLNEVQTIHSCNPHDVNFKEAITLAERLGETSIPKKIIVIGIVLSTIPLDFSEELSEPIKMAITKATQMVLSEIK